MKLNSFQGKLKLLSEQKNLKQKVELWLLNGEVNRNGWKYTNLKEHKDLFAGTPILVAYVGNKIGDGHNFSEVMNADGTVTASFISSTAERIVGLFSDTKDIRIENVDNQQWIVGTGYLWKWYAQELVTKLRKQGAEGMSISIETLVDEYHMEDDVEVYTKYQILGTTILGDDVTPAVAGANIVALNTIGAEEVKKMTLRVASMQNPQNNSKGDLAKMLKKLQEKFDGYKVLGATDTIVALSKDGKTYSYKLNESEEIDLEKVEECVVNSVFGEGDDSISVNIKEIIEPLETKLNAIEQEKADLETAKTEIEKTNSKLAEENSALKKENAELKAKNLEQRKEDVKNAILNRLEKIKSSLNGCDDISADSLLTDEKLEEYANAECGIENAEKDVDSLSMETMLECKNANNSFVWEKMKSNTKVEVSGINRNIQNVKQISK